MNVPSAAQDHYVRSQPEYFFVPPYVGPRGWLGVQLNKGLPWPRIAALIRQAYEKVAPETLAAGLGATPAIIAPRENLSTAQIDPLQSARAVKVLTGLRKICLDLPECTEGLQIGHPVWRAGAKSFLWASSTDARLELSFWVGIARQGLLISDPRFRIPPYTGHLGWITLDVSRHCNWREIATHESYLHYALKRMKALMQQPAKPASSRQASLWGRRRSRTAQH